MEDVVCHHHLPADKSYFLTFISMSQDMSFTLIVFPTFYRDTVEETERSQPHI